jgi:hypothetical protein
VTKTSTLSLRAEVVVDVVSSWGRASNLLYLRHSQAIPTHRRGSSQIFVEKVT